MDISAVVPCYNAAAYLQETVSALRQQTLPVREILIVDDGSTDGTIEVARSIGCEVIRHPFNRGLAVARNTGIRHAGYDFIAFVDADVALEKDYLAVLAAGLQAHGAALAGGRLVERHRRTAPDRWRALHMPQDNGVELLLFDRPRQGRLAGFATLGEREAAVRVGGYDTRFRRSYEDVDMSHRLLAAGYRLVYCPGAVAYHCRRDSTISLLRSAWSWDHWPELFGHSYHSFGALLRKLRKNCGWLVELSLRHAASGDFPLVWLDLVMWGCFTWWDVRYFVFLKGGLMRKLFPRAPLGNLNPDETLLSPDAPPCLDWELQRTDG